jgi:TolA-binding protein
MERGGQRMSNVNTNKFGGALLFILGEFAAAEVEMIEDGGMEVFGEDNQGREGSCEVSINELAQAASDEIKNLKEQLAEANERVAKLECENINGNAAAELLIWWAQKLNNAPNEDLKEVIRIGYKRIVNLANLIGEEQLRKEQDQ